MRRDAHELSWRAAGAGYAVRGIWARSWGLDIGREFVHSGIGNGTWDAK